MEKQKAVAASRQTRDVEPMLFRCWPSKQLLPFGFAQQYTVARRWVFVIRQVVLGRYEIITKTGGMIMEITNMISVTLHGGITYTSKDKQQ